MKKSEDEVLEIIRTTVARARNIVDDIEWSAMDATRTPIDYLCRCVEMAIAQGATTINLPDTVGYATPDEYRAMFEAVRNRVPNADKAIFSVHTHNDLGLAVANALAGIAGGARQIECTINGIGERAGNAALEEELKSLRQQNETLRVNNATLQTKPGRAEQRIGDGVQQGVGVRMAEQAFAVGNFHPAQHQLAPLHQCVNVPAFADSDVCHGFSFCARSRRAVSTACASAKSWG
jgi:2-isopropylmalate synthase